MGKRKGRKKTRRQKIAEKERLADELNEMILPIPKRIGTTYCPIRHEKTEPEGQGLVEVPLMVG